MFILLLALLFLTPIAYADGNFTVNIPNSQGSYTPIQIKQTGNGYIGPRGEYYSQFPTVYQLQAMYGNQSNDVQREQILEQQGRDAVAAETQRELEQQRTLNQQVQENFAKQEAQQKTQQLTQKQQEQQAETRKETRQTEIIKNTSLNTSASSKDDSSGAIWLVTFLGILWLIGILLYFVPSVIAFKRKHKNFIPILLVNIFFGWTFIGWVIALVWSFSHQNKKET
jgi:uncharacterized membrane protein